MAYIAVDLDGKEHTFEYHPIRREGHFWGLSQKDTGYMLIPKGSVKKLIGRELSWQDDAVEI